MKIENLTLWFNKKTRLYAVSGRVNGKTYSMVTGHRVSRQDASQIIWAKAYRNL